MKAEPDTHQDVIPGFRVDLEGETAVYVSHFPDGVCLAQVDLSQLRTRQTSVAALSIEHQHTYISLVQCDIIRNRTCMYIYILHTRTTLSI